MKNLTLLLSLVLFTSNAMAGLNMKPGLWALKSTIVQDGKTIDPQAEIKKTLAKMAPAQRKQMEAMMKKMGGNVTADDMKACYTKEMIDNEKALSQSKEGCETKITTKTSSKVAGDFTCKDGSKGTMEWAVSDNTHFKGKVHMTRESKDTDISYSGTFVKADCGDVKPIDMGTLQSHI